MTAREHLELYEELKPVLYNRTKGYFELTEAQRYFVESFEIASFDDNFLASYAKLVDNKPDISARNLHAFCLGYGLGRSLELTLNSY
jgi:hypothetical protein